MLRECRQLEAVKLLNAHFAAVGWDTVFAALAKLKYGITDVKTEDDSKKQQSTQRSDGHVERPPRQLLVEIESATPALDDTVLQRYKDACDAAAEAAATAGAEATVITTSVLQAGRTRVQISLVLRCCIGVTCILRTLNDRRLAW